VSSPLSYPRSGTALHGLLILALAGILMDCLFSAQEAIETATTEPVGSTASCLYQVMHDDYCLGAAFLSRPETLSKILQTVGLADDFGSTDSLETVPCDKVIKFSGNSPFYSLEKIVGAYLVRSGRPIDINVADEIDLLAVPGIGPRTAEKIVRYRETVGGFSRVEDLKKIPGIGSKKFATMAPFVEAKPSGPVDKLQYVQTP